ncbi:hypothetical protein EYC84_002317 [Monilinia fructicola]|uniref:Uncharacterized protein n=1 Tax=Monilinia fructicola TaxID=38448 RepID=A0A5M9JPP1_MONFR|nr:hypothetical protein EYC84_002317 [Monilinia fructicola]
MVDDKVSSFCYDGYHYSRVESIDETIRPIFLDNGWDQAVRRANDLIMEFWETTPWYSDKSSNDQYLPITRAIKLAWEKLGVADIFGAFAHDWKIKREECTELKCLLKLFHSK